MTSIRDLRMASPRKVLITGGHEVGGMNAFAVGLSEGFAALGIPAEVITPAQVLRRWRDLRDPEVLKILSTRAAFAAPFARRAICVAHGFPRVDVAKWTKSAAIFASYKIASSISSSRFVAVSDYVAAQLRCLFNLRVDGVIHNPVQSSFLEPFELSETRCYMTFVGRLVEAKNVDRLLPAMRGIQKENPHLRICIVGDGPQRQTLESSLPADSTVQFMGNLDASSVRGILRRTKVFISGNEMEPFGIAYVEALSQGCAVVMPASGGGLEIAPELIGNRVQLFPLSFDYQGVCCAIQRALSAPDNSFELTAYGPRFVAEAYLQVYRTGFASHRAPREQKQCVPSPSA